MRETVRDGEGDTLREIVGGTVRDGEGDTVGVAVRETQWERQ